MHAERMSSSDPVTEDKISDLWEEMQQVDLSLRPSDSTAEKVKDKMVFQQFLGTYMVECQYFVSLKKCG